MTIHLQMSYNGRVIIPKKVREVLGLRPGGTLVAKLFENTLQITSMENSVNSARELVKKYCVNSNRSLVEDLFMMRQEEVVKD